MVDFSRQIVKCWERESFKMVKAPINKFLVKLRSGFYDEKLEDLFQCTLPLVFALSMMLITMLMAQELLSIRESDYKTGDDPYSYMVVSKVLDEKSPKNVFSRSVTFSRAPDRPGDRN